MPNTDNNTIELHVSPGSKYMERTTGDVPYYPGTFLMLEPTAFALKLNVYAPVSTGVTYDQRIPTTIAVESSYEGKTIDDEYSSGDKVYARVLLPGDEVLAWLEDGQATSIGSVLRYGTAGRLTTAGPGVAVAVALESVTASGAAARIKVEIA